MQDLSNAPDYKDLMSSGGRRRVARYSSAVLLGGALLGAGWYAAQWGRNKTQSVATEGIGGGWDNV